MAKRKGLGRGLDVLLGANSRAVKEDTPALETVRAATEAVAVLTSSDTKTRDGILKDIPIEFLQRGKYQPRRDMHQEALEELAESIRAQGVMQPIVVRQVAEHRYEIIAGERRWRAAQLAALESIPAVVRDVPDEAAIAMALIENIQREDLNPIEEAMALKRFQEEFELTQQEVAEAVGKSRTTVTNLMRLIQLPEDVRKMVEHGDLEMGHARCLLTLPEDKQRYVAHQIVAKGLSVRQAEALARKIPQVADTETLPVDADIKNLQTRLEEKVGVPVMIQHNSKGKGKLVLKYNNLDELDGILHHLGYEP